MYRETAAQSLFCSVCFKIYIVTLSFAVAHTMSIHLQCQCALQGHTKLNYEKEKLPPKGIIDIIKIRIHIEYLNSSNDVFSQLNQILYLVQQKKMKYTHC